MVSSQRDGVCIGATTQQAVCEECATCRRQAKKQKLRWCISNCTSAQHAPGWIFFKARALTVRNGQVRFQGIHIGLWDSYGLSACTFGAGSLCEDARGRWYRNVCVKYEPQQKRVPDSATPTGIAPRRRTMAICSDGTAITMPRWYRLSEQALDSAQRARKKRLDRALHARIGKQRQDALHKETTVLVVTHAALFVANVNATALARTNMAKSVLDASWSTVRTQRPEEVRGVE